MALKEFRRALTIALNHHLSEAKVTIRENRGVVLTCRAKVDTDTFVAVYFNALTGKTSYALIYCGQRVVGYDNYKFWHHHPAGEPDRHIPCPQPVPEEAIAELARVMHQIVEGRK